MAKRIIYLSRLNVFLFILALLSLVHRLDSVDQQADLRSLDLLTSGVESVVLQRALERGVLHSAALTWLLDHNETEAEYKIGRQNIDVRDKITQLLQAHGISNDDLIDVKGRRDANGEDHFRLISIDIEEPLPNEFLEVEEYTVNEAVSVFELMARPRQLNVAVAVEESSLPNLKSFLGNRGDDLQSRETALPWELMGVYLQKDEHVHVIVEEKLENTFAQREPRTITDTLRVRVTQVEGPSIYTLGNSENADVNSLRLDPEQRTRLREIYGSLPLALARETVAEEFVRSYKSIDMFGFTVSTRRYPFAILLLALLSAWGIAWTVEAARRTGKRILRDIQNKDIVDAFLDFGLARFVLWAVLPVLSIWGALPLFPLNVLEQIILYVGMVVVALLGVVATLRARGL